MGIWRTVESAHLIGTHVFAAQISPAVTLTNGGWAPAEKHIVQPNVGAFRHDCGRAPHELTVPHSAQVPKNPRARVAQAQVLVRARASVQKSSTVVICGRTR